MFWNKKKKLTNEGKERFEHLLMVANKLPKVAIPDLLRAIVRPTQSDFILAVGEEGTDARPNIDEGWFFFHGIFNLLDITQMEKGEKNRNDFPLSLANDMVLPWPWKIADYINSLSTIGTHKGLPWKQDGNHRITVWLPWKIAFVKGGNHSIMAGILAGDGTVIPEYVYDMSYLFEKVKTDGVYWYVNGQKEEPVSSWRHAAFFEIGRLLVDVGNEFNS